MVLSRRRPESCEDGEFSPESKMATPKTEADKKREQNERRSSVNATEVVCPVEVRYGLAPYFPRIIKETIINQ